MRDADELWAALPLPALVVDGANRIAAINPAAEQFLRRSETQLSGSPVAALLGGDIPIMDAFGRARNDRAAISVRDVPVIVAGKEPEHCRLQLSPLLSSRDDAFDGGVLVVLQSNRSFQDLIRNPASTAARSAIGMSEMLAHEIRNPLAGISGAAQLLAMTLAGEERELTEMIVSETRRISRLLDQVAQFGNLLPPDRKPTNLHDVLDRARKSALLGFAGDIEIVEEYDPSLPAAHCDADQLQQVILNLLKNAAEALCDTRDGCIRIRTRYESGLRIRDTRGHLRPASLQIEIVDNGPGLAPAIADAVFDPFVSGRGNGTGLGLALVSKIVAEHDGRIGVKSAPGQTVFTVSLPAAQGQARRKAEVV